MLRRIRAFVDERTGLGGWLEQAGRSPLPGGARWSRTFGALTLGLIALEALTGLGLSAWYAPSVTDAWASVYFIHSKLTLGWLLRGVHHVGGTALIVVAILHLLQALVYGAYRAPRELTWITGVVSVQVLIFVSHTGYLLPNDLRAYWATQVLLGIAGNQPGIGELGQTVIQGGPAFGNATLVHLYAMHVLLMPGALIGITLVHLLLKKKHGSVAPVNMPAAEAEAKSEPYWPNQAFKDLALLFVVFAGVTGWVVYTHGVELGAPADPAVEYVARPEWYFYPVFHLRHWFTGSTEFIATTVLPGVATVALALLPFVSPRLQKLTQRAHAVIVTAVILGLVATIYLGVTTAMDDAKDEKGQAILARAEVHAREQHRLAEMGVPVTGPLDLYKNDPRVWGARVWTRDCVACHSDCSTDPYKGSPCMEGYATRTWISKFLRNPRAPHFYGNTKIDEMDAFDGDDQKLTMLVEMLYRESGRADANADTAELGKKLYVDEGCASCHSMDGVGTGDAPDLKGWASEAYLRAFIRTPDATRFYGKLNEMDSFPHDKLSSDELTAVIAYLRAQSEVDAKF